MYRKMIKWQPFYSIKGMDKLVYEINLEKEKNKMPILSDDQLQTLDFKIKENFEKKNKIEMKYFKNGFTKKEVGIIDKINQTYKYLTINNIRIYFKFIIKVEEI